MKKITFLVLAAALNMFIRGDSLSLSLFQGFSDNLFQNYYPENDQISSISLQYEKGWNDFSFYTKGEYTKFFNNDDASFYSHEIGLDYLLTSKGKSAIYIGFNLFGDFFKQAYSDYSNRGIMAAVAFKTYVTDASIFKASYSLQYKSYQYDIFDAVTHNITASIDRYFTTRTTLKAGFNWGYKYFLHPFSSTEVVRGTLEESLPDLPGSSVSASGNGSNVDKYNGRNLLRFSSAENGEGVQTLALSGLLAQGLGERIGISFSFSRQWILSGESPFMTNGDFYLLENPSYDQFSFGETFYEFKLTANTIWDIQLKAGRQLSRRDFPGIAALDLDGLDKGEVRSDERTIWNISLEKIFRKVSVYFSFSFIDNISNDDLFNWKENIVSLGLEWSLEKTEK